MTRRRLLAAVAGGLGVLLVSAVTWIFWPLPAGLTAPPPTQSLSIQDRHGLLLRSTRASGGERVRWVPLADIDPNVLQAFLATEDRHFFSHHGIDLPSVARAALEDLRAGHVVSGASTITMQLARLLCGTGRGWGGKLVQALWALRLERHLSKQQILEQYLNRVPLGQGATGIAAAAHLYFDASATRLSVAEAALLAGLASAPSADNPFVAPTRARARRDGVLKRMGRLGFASPAALRRAAAEPLVPRPTQAPFLAPHFTSRLLRWAEDSGTALAGTWRTSLDLRLQTLLEAEVRHTVDLLHDHGVRQAAVVVLDNRSGQILAWVGSPDFWSDTAGQVDMVVSPRQPGSALKPFLYGMAFDHGYTAASVLPDIPQTYATSTGPYQPRDYDRRFHGPVRAREALASSFNVPAVELTNRLGAAALLHTLHLAGFTSLDHSAEYYGLGLALGNGDVTLLELADAYRALANGGVWHPYRWRAAPLGEAATPPPGRRVMSAGAAAIILDILSDPVARVPGFGVTTPFDFPFPLAAKTGTSHHYTDNWAVGVTEGFTVAVWAGNFSGRPMHDVSGVTGAGPLLHRAVLDVARYYDPGVIPSPAAVGTVRRRVCRLSGLLATRGCASVGEWFLPGTAPTVAGDWRDGAGDIVWPAEYADWAAEHGKLDARPPGRLRPGATVLAGSSRVFEIVSPLDGDRYSVPPGMDPRYATIALRAAGTPTDQPVRWSVDGHRLRGTRWRLEPGTHAIRAISASGHTATVHIDVE